MSDYVQTPPELAEAMAATGLTPPDNIEPGKFSRFPGAGKRNSNKAGWCRLFPDGEGAVFGDWSTGLKEVWQAREPANDAERRQRQEQIAKACKEADRKRARAHQRAAQTAADTWAAAGPADPLHGYLVAKGVKAHGIRQDGNQLLIPLTDEYGEIRSLQRIDTAGNKLFLPDSDTAGKHRVIGELGNAMVICEGYSTGASIHESTGLPVVIAFSVDNLQKVAEVLRRKHPETRLILAADDDRDKPVNSGLTKARAAAEAVSGELVTPGQAGDFNDLHSAQGAEAVRARFDKPVRPGPVLPLVEIADLDQAELPEPEHIIEKLLPVGVPTLLGGHGGTGKSFLGKTMAVCVASGQPFMGLEVQSVPVLFFSAEDGTEILRYRLAKIFEAEGVRPTDLAERLHVIDATDLDPTLFTEKQIRDDEGLTRRGITTPMFDELARKAIALQARFIVIDNASDTFEANENERPRVRAFIRALAWLARRTNGAVLLLSHVDKATAKAGGGSEGYSGSTAWHNSARSRMFLHGDGRNLTLEHQKANLGEMAEPLLMHWHHGTLAPGHTVTSTDPAREVMDTRHQMQILQMIHERTERGHSISTSTTAGNAWLILHRLEDFPKIDKATFWRLLDKAEGAGRLQRETYQDEKRMHKTRFTVTAAGLDWCRMIATELER